MKLVLYKRLEKSIHLTNSIVQTVTQFKMFHIRKFVFIGGCKAQNNLQCSRTVAYGVCRDQIRPFRFAAIFLKESNKNVKAFFQAPVPHVEVDGFEWK